MTVFLIAAAVGTQSALVFLGLALLVSQSWIAKACARLRRGIEAAFATVFGLAAIGFPIAIWRRTSN